MKNNLKYIVYCTICTISKKIYVGVHNTNPEFYDYYIGNGCYANKPSTYENPKTHFQYAIKKYGAKAFIRFTIAIFDTSDEAYLLEEQIVNKKFLERSDVYNMALGGLGGSWNMTAIPVYTYDANGNFVAKYDSIMQVSRALNRNMKTIQDAIKYKMKCANNYITTKEYNKLDLTKMHQYTGHECIPVFQYDNKGNYECCYDSIQLAEKVLKIHHTNIGNAIKLGTICHNKYFTMVYSETFSIAKDIQNRSRYIYQYDLDGNYLAEFPSMAVAKKALGIKSDIYRAIKLGRTVGNFQWSFEKLDRMPKVTPKSGRARKIGKYDKDWNLIKEYPSLSSCKKENGSGMIHVLEGRDEFAKGFRYKYLS